ncbi:MAG TPA: nucleotidyl transferase AbiEii/AbiGii toxin family protein [Solirubrobacteraceae bacterium]
MSEASEPSLPEKIVAIHEQLTRSKTPHAFGGALALAYYAEPRATIDVDLNLFVAPSSYLDIERELGGIGVGDGVDLEVVERDGQCRLRWGNTPIDLFFAYDALHDAMRRSARSEPFGETKIPVLAPEHLLVCKAIFNRPKDWLDIEQMLVCVEDLDLTEVRTWLDRIVGADDPRRERFDQMVEACEA